MVNTRTTKAPAAAEGQKKPTSRPKTLTKAPVVKGEAFKPRKSTPAKPSTAKPMKIEPKETTTTVDPPKMTQATVQEPVLETEPIREGETMEKVTSKIKSPSKGMSSVSPVVKPSATTVDSIPSGSEVVLDDLVKKSVSDSVVGDQVVVGGGSISISDLVARIQAELMAKLASEQAVRVVEQTVKESEPEKAIVEEKRVSDHIGTESVEEEVQVTGQTSEKESDMMKVPETVAEKSQTDQTAENASEESSDEEPGDEEQEEIVPSAESEGDSDPSTVPSATSMDTDERSPIAELKKSVQQSKKRSAPVKKAMVSKRVKIEKKPTTVQGSLFKGVWFSSSVHADRWAVIQHRSIVAEKVLNVKKYPGMLVDLLSESKLIGSLRKAGKYSEKLVREVIVNLPAQFGARGSEHYGQLRVRGKAAYITPELINVCLDAPQWSSEAVPDDLNVIAREITQGVKVHWKGTNFKASELSTKYSFLYQIAHYNWMPSTHRGTVTKELAKLIYAVGLKKRVNLGELVFAHLEKHSMSAREQLPIGFPSLIHQLVLEQFPKILASGETLSPDPKVFAMDHKLFAGSRVIDVPSGTSVRVPEKILMSVSMHMKFAKEVRGQITFLENEIKRMQVQRVQLQDLLADLGTLSSSAPEEEADDSAEE